MDGIEVDLSSVVGSEKILTLEALFFIRDLVRFIKADIDYVMEVRQKRRLTDFNFKTPVEPPPDWRADPLPPDLLDRRVEITGPPTRKMVINALNSGANVYMADLEDSCSPTWDNVIDGQVNLYDAVRLNITHEENGKRYQLNEKTATLMVRPRGWHLFEHHVRVDGEPVRAALVDFGLFAYHNARELVRQHRTPAFYLPKMEWYIEARVWDDVFEYVQGWLGIPVGTFKATCLIETLPAVFEMEMIIHRLRHHIAGLNCGRWDYIFSFIKKQSSDPLAVLPDRSTLTMDKPFLNAYAELLIQTCHRRGIHAMGGMAAQIPIKGNVVANDIATLKVLTDKQREVMMGHDGTWVAHPGLVALAQEEFKGYGPNQIDRSRNDVPVTREMLLAVPTGVRTENSLRHNIRVGVMYLAAWLGGNGCVPLYDLMEDAATAEISRAQVWQQLHHGASVGGQPLTRKRFDSVFKQETASFVGGRFPEAIQLFYELSVAPTLADFLTVPAYHIL
jgi:malate synthase